MALVGLTIVLASISLFFCRSQAIAALSHLWPPSVKQKSRPRIEGEGSDKQKEKVPDAAYGRRKSNDTQPNAGNPALRVTEEKSSPPPSTSSIASEAEGMMFKGDRSKLERATSPQRLSSKPQSTDAQLMPPPPRPAPISMTSRPRPQPSNPGTTLRVPTTGPLPNRGPPAAGSLSKSSTLVPQPASTSTLPVASRNRKKVLLAPGHSPLDWAALTRSQSLSGVPYPQRITPSQLSLATGRKGKPAWSSYKGRVYNIGPYLPFHPGGEAELMRAAGRDGQSLFEEIHAWVNWENMLGSCLVGFLVSEDEAAKAEEGLDSLD